MHQLLGHRWPGNVRELRNLMDFVAAIVDGETLLPWHIQDQLASTLPAETPSPSEAKSTSVPVPAPPALPPVHFRPIEEELRELERRRMTEALAASGGVQVRAGRADLDAGSHFYDQDETVQARPPKRRREPVNDPGSFCSATAL